MELSLPDEPERPSPFAIRQVLRRAMAAALPRSWFAVNGSRNDNRVCLTFDDGPHPQHSLQVLEVLKEHKVTATFFVIGERARQYPGIIGRMAKEGHELGHHSFYHRDPASVSATQLIDEAKSTSALIREITGTAPVLFRPPHGKLTVRKMLRLWAAGQSIVLWSVDPKDYVRQSADEVAEYVRSNPLQGGDIVLMHDNLPHAAAVLPALIESALKDSLRFTSVSAGIARQ
jgi:peptidoglycan/xylan/chitin deacetylase (PgdA/CDA1 family)